MYRCSGESARQTVSLLRRFVRNFLVQGLQLQQRRATPCSPWDLQRSRRPRLCVGNSRAPAAPRAAPPRAARGEVRGACGGNKNAQQQRPVAWENKKQPCLQRHSGKWRGGDEARPCLQFKCSKAARNPAPAWVPPPSAVLCAPRRGRALVHTRKETGATNLLLWRDSLLKWVRRTSQNLSPKAALQRRK